MRKWSWVLALTISAAACNQQRALAQQGEIVPHSSTEDSLRGVNSTITRYASAASAYGTTIQKAVAMAKAPGSASNLTSVNELGKAAEAALDATASMDERLISLAREAKHMKTRYEREAADARDRAEDFTEPAAKAAQLALAARFDAFAAAVPADQNRIAALRKEIPEAKRLMRDLTNAANDLALHMRVAPSGPAEEEMGAFRSSVDQIAARLASFDASLGAFRGTRKDDGADRPEPRTPQKKPSAEFISTGDYPVVSGNVASTYDGGRGSWSMLSSKTPAPYPGSNPKKPPAPYPGSARRLR